MTKNSLVNDREIFDCFIRHESLRKLRVSFDFLLGHPLWWASFKVNDNSKAIKNSIESSYDIWRDPRAKQTRLYGKIYSTLRKRARETRPFLFNISADLVHFCLPLVVGKRAIGYFGLIGIKKGLRQEVLNLLTSNISLILENCSKTEELDRLSATIRPRAIALSTVHTVHRIINSTLNLDELISRLAHLTAQVLKADVCKIYLTDQAPRYPRRSRPMRLTCRASVG